MVETRVNPTPSALTPRQYAQHYLDTNQLSLSACGSEIPVEKLTTEALLAEMSFASVRDDPVLPNERRSLKVLASLVPEEYDSLGIVKAKSFVDKFIHIADMHYGSSRILPDESTPTDNMRGEI